MKVSIITPAFNSVKTIERTILSVLNQSYKDIEYIIIDGGSTDGAVEIIKKYQNKLAYWISEKDNGQADAINKGFKKATGEIVCWLNADDYYEKNIFEDVVENFKKEKNLVLLYGNCRSIIGKKEIINIPDNKINVKKLINRGNLIFQPSSFYRYNLVKKVGYLDDKLNYWMEYDLNIKLLLEGKSKYLNKIFSNFVVSFGQKSNLKNIIEMDKELWNIAKKNGASFFSKVNLSTIIHKLKIE